LFSGIAAAGYHRVNYFKGVDTRGKHNIFYEKVLKVKDVAIFTFADFVQLLLVDYIRDVLQPEAADWFSTWWTGACGQYRLAHAGYGGSSNNMGVEVDWRDVKGLVPSSVTIGAFTGALVKFVADIGTKHQDFLKPTDSLFPSTRVMTKPIYDQLQEFDRDTLWYSFLTLVAHNENAPLHLKIKTYHDDIARGDTQAIKLNA
jgi:hypothetical protein